MPYIKEICIAGSVITVRRYHTLRYNCKGEKRENREKLTTEKQEAINRRLAERKLAAKMNANFTDDTGMLVTFTYAKDSRPPTLDDMSDDIRNLLKNMRREFKNIGPLKYIYVKELGTKGAHHIHMIMSVCDVRVLKKCWCHGFVHVRPLDSDNDYTRIAEYFVKYADKTEKTLGRRVGKRWNSSRNLKEPVVIKKVVNANTFAEKTRRSTIRKYEEQGFYFVKDSERSGISELGFRYYEAKFRRTKGGSVVSAEGKYICTDDS